MGGLIGVLGQVAVQRRSRSERLRAERHEAYIDVLDAADRAIWMAQDLDRIESEVAELRTAIRSAASTDVALQRAWDEKLAHENARLNWGRGQYESYRRDMDRALARMRLASTPLVVRHAGEELHYRFRSSGMGDRTAEMSRYYTTFAELAAADVRFALGWWPARSLRRRRLRRLATAPQPHE